MRFDGSPSWYLTFYSNLSGRGVFCYIPRTISDKVNAFFNVITIVMVFVTNEEMNESQFNVVTNVEKSIAHRMLTPAMGALIHKLL